MLPFFVKSFLAHLLSLLWFYVIRFKRKVMLLNLSKVFPRKKQESTREFKQRCESLAQKNMHHLILLVFEALERPFYREKDKGRKFFVSGDENLFKYIREGQGVFFLTSHLGNWEIMTVLGVLLNFPLDIIGRYLRSPFWDYLLKKSRLSAGVGLIEEKNSGIHIIRSIKSARMVGFMADQHTGDPHGLPSTFLGIEDAWTPKGLTILAARLKAPILPAYIYRDKKGSHQLVIEEALEFNFQDKKVTSNSEDMKNHLLLINKKMEEQILKHPEQYNWMHKRFKRAFNYKTEKLPWS